MSVFLGGQARKCVPKTVKATITKGYENTGIMLVRMYRGELVIIEAPQKQGTVFELEFDVDSIFFSFQEGYLRYIRNGVGCTSLMPIVPGANYMIGLVGKIDFSFELYYAVR